MKFKGTEKWVLGRIDESYQYINGKGWEGFARVVVKMKGASYTSSTGEANAKLIAAAPELLNALQVCVGQIERSPNKFSWLEKRRIAEKAIEKALK